LLNLKSQTAAKSKTTTLADQLKIDEARWAAKKSTAPIPEKEFNVFSNAKVLSDTTSLRQHEVKLY